MVHLMVRVEEVFMDHLLRISSPFMLAFDQPAPFGTKGRRSVSNVPAQSLALLNDPFVIEQCKLMGKNIFDRKERTLFLCITFMQRSPPKN